MSLVNLCTLVDQAHTISIAQISGGNLCTHVGRVEGDAGLSIGGVLQNLRAAPVPQYVQLPQQAYLPELSYQPELTNLRLGSNLMKIADRRRI